MTCVTSISESSAMNDTEKIKMYLNIGGCQIPVTVPYSQQELNRDVEKQVESLYTSWRHQFTKRTDREILAMVAYQFAFHYVELLQRYNQAAAMADECAAILDRMEKMTEEDSSEAAE